MFCPNCGAKSENSKFCPECGYKMPRCDGSSCGTGTLTLRKYNSPRMNSIRGDVYIDGEFLGVVDQTGLLTLTLPAGDHELLVHVDGCADAIQHVSVNALENRLCIFSVDEAGFVSIVQQGELSKPKASSGYASQTDYKDLPRSGAAAFAVAEEELQFNFRNEAPITRSYTEPEDESVWTTVPQGATAPEKTKFCKFCGSLIHEESVVCPNCGRQVEQLRVDEPRVIIQNSNNQNVVNQHTYEIHSGREKNKWVAFFLCLFLGVIGAHKFYEGKPGMGILYLFTAGFCYIGVLIDLVAILMKPNPYYV